MWPSGEVVLNLWVEIPWGWRIRCCAHQISALRFLTVAKSQLQNNKDILSWRREVAITWGTVGKVGSMRKIENPWPSNSNKVRWSQKVIGSLGQANSVIKRKSMHRRHSKAPVTEPTIQGYVLVGGNHNDRSKGRDRDRGTLASRHRDQAGNGLRGFS